MRIARALLLGHLAALLFGLGGLLIALPHPELWAGDPRAARVFDFGMRYAGSLHILCGATAVFAFGLTALGARRTSIFFVAATALSLSSELIGTGTGWPFGAYSYTSFLGHKLQGRVPFTIPLSWFYLGLTAFVLGSLIAARWDLRPRAGWSVGLGVWFLTIWDLVLDPAMAHPSLRVRFWIWHETGPYFGMPVKNFIGWSLTGLLFMTVSRLLWRGGIDPARVPAWFPTTVYAANVGFAMVLSAGVGLWWPIALATAGGLLPATLAWRFRPLPPALAAESRSRRPLLSR